MTRRATAFLRALRRAVLPALAAALFSPSAGAGDAAAGATKAATCVACHGEGGNKPISNYPKLAGQHQKYLVRALLDYQTGARTNAVMNAQAAGLSLVDIEDLAAHYAAQPGDLR